MARPLFVKNSNASWAQASDYNINNGSWTRGKLIYVKTDNGWEHEHEYQDQVWLAAATCQSGTKYRSDCPCGAQGGAFYDTDVNPNNHTGSIVNGKEATVHSKYNCCGAVVSSTHSYGTPSYAWSSDHTSCTATAACSCGYKLTEPGTVTRNYYPATCTKQEKWNYVAEFINSPFESQYCPDWHYGSKDPDNHTGTASFTGYTSNGDYYGTHKTNYKYSCCGATYSVSEGCDNTVERVTKQPTCTDNGETRVYCSKCGAENGFVDVPAATGHKFPQTYTDFGTNWHAKVCTVCGEYYDYHYAGGSGECNICNK